MVMNSGVNPAGQRIRILLADDHPSLRMGLSLIISAEPDMTIAGQADTGREAIEQYRLLQPDVTLMDLRMADLSGIEALAAIRSEFRKARVVVLTAFNRIEDIYQSVRAGAVGYVVKDAPVDEIIRAIRQVHGGGRYFQSEIADKIADRLLMADLRERELEVLRLIIEGKSNKEIAQALLLAPGTVGFHVNNLLTKLGASDRTQAVIIALKRGIVDI